jgi:hypothetical protein
MVETVGSASQESPSVNPKAVLADLIVVATEHEDPNHRVGALERLVPRMQAPAMAQVLIDRIKRDSDISVLWLCLGWLLQRYGENREAEKAILARLEREPDPQLRKDILQLVSLRLGSSDPVRRAVAGVAAKDPDYTVRVDAANTLTELERLRSAPPLPAPASHSTRQLEAWVAVEISHHREAS